MVIGKILLADDHKIFRLGLKTFIRNIIPRVDIDEAWDGDSAFKKVKRNEYKLIILDIFMPGTDSFSLVPKILAEKPRSKILILTITKDPTQDYEKRFADLGALGYLNKEAPALEK